MKIWPRKDDTVRLWHSRGETISAAYFPVLLSTYPGLRCLYTCS
jgi:hypothetical protein